MYRVVVVEDARIVLEDVVKMVSSYQPPLEVCGTAKDGITALKIIKEVQPDIVITDIRMPRMDGMELIEKARRVNSKIKFIIFSGYAEFEYARESLKLGVAEYLLKPLQNKELYAALDKVIHGIEDDQKMSSRINHSDMVEKQKKQADIENTLNELMFSKYESSIALRFCKDIGQDPLETYFSLMIIHINNIAGYDPPFKDGDPGLARFEVKNIAGDTCAERIQTIISFNLRDYNEVSVLLYEKHEDELRKKTAILANSTLENIKSRMGISITIGVSSIVYGITGIKKIYNEASRALERRFAFGCGRVFFYHGNIDTNVKETDAFYHQMEALKRCFEDKDIKRIVYSSKKVLQSVFSTEKIKQHTNMNIRLYFAKVVIIIENFAEKIGVAAEDFIGKDVISGDIISTFDTCDNILDYLTDLVDRVAGLLQQSNDGSFKIEMVKNYVDRNFMNSISLSEMAARFSIDTSYLCKVFKKKYSMNFVEYVNSLKVNKAKELLKETNFSIDNIAETLGFNSNIYFFKVFRKYTGITPLEFRLIIK